MLSGGHFDSGFLNGASLFVGHQSELVIGAYGGDFCYGQTFDEQRIVIEMKLADLEILNSTQGLDAI